MTKTPRQTRISVKFFWEVVQSVYKDILTTVL